MSATSPPEPTTRVVEGTAPATAEILPASVSDDVLDDVVATLNSWQRESTFAFGRQVGRLLLDRFYGGDLEAWRNRGAKDASFRKLAKRAESGVLQVSAAALYRSVALVELEARLGVSTWKHLTVSHVRAVFGLPEADQRRLLTQAEEKEWSTAQLDEKASKIRGRLNDGRGRPKLPAFVKSIGKLRRMLDDKEELFGELEAVDELDEQDALALYQTVTGMKLHCEELQKKLAVKVPGLT